MNLPENCPRCDVSLRTTSSIMSKFNLEHICSKCKRREIHHPEYQRADELECAAVRAGVKNYEGIGAPPDLYLPEVVVTEFEK